MFLKPFQNIVQLTWFPMTLGILRQESPIPSLQHPRVHSAGHDRGRYPSDLLHVRIISQVSSVGISYSPVGCTPRKHSRHWSLETLPPASRFVPSNDTSTRLKERITGMFSWHKDTKKGDNTNLCSLLFFEY